jgi:hypothetical protein
MQHDDRYALAAQGLKRCGSRAGCGRVLPVAEFNRQRDTWDELKTRCRNCTRGLDRDYYAEAPQELRDQWNAQGLARQKANPEKANAKVRRWMQANPDRAHAISKRYRDRYKRACRIDGCEDNARSHRGIDLCNSHYHKQRRRVAV